MEKKFDTADMVVVLVVLELQYLGLIALLVAQRLLYFRLSVIGCDRYCLVVFSDSDKNTLPISKEFEGISLKNPRRCG